MQVSHITDTLQTPAMWRLAQFIRQRQHQWQTDEASPEAPAVSAPLESEAFEPQVSKSKAAKPVASTSSSNRHDSSG